MPMRVAVPIAMMIFVVFCNDRAGGSSEQTPDHCPGSVTSHRTPCSGPNRTANEGSLFCRRAGGPQKDHPDSRAKKE